MLARPQLQRFTEAATYFENGASKVETSLQAMVLLNRWGVCQVGKVEGTLCAVMLPTLSKPPALRPPHFDA